ncbi:MAG TPA: hypothetical protein VHF27_13925 [Acidimicrobiales bacterium]|nr:hypothetical protein [Acidimicrobiales bacterium]
MTNRQDPAEQLLDLLVYAPLGLLLEARDLVPKLADKGRQRMGGQVTVARMIGELAVRQGQRRAERFVQRLREQPARPPSSSPSGEEPANGHRPAPSAATTPSSAASPPAADASSLAIPGYDTLSASQVVPRLEGLSAAELEAIRGYEEATRARKTVLTRIDQLLGN